MRALSHELFRSGSALGPECLLKFLRHRFKAGASVDTYSASDARVEYVERLASYEALRTRIRDSGPRWICHECSQEFPATGYGTTHTNTAEVYRLCVALGYWRRCLACARGRDSATLLADHAAKVLCQTCNQWRGECFMDEEEKETCTACVLSYVLVPLLCQMCGKHYPRARMLSLIHI